MLRKPFRCLYLVLPSECLFAILREFHIKRRIGVNEIVWFQFQRCEIEGCEPPTGEEHRIITEILHVINRLIPAKGHVELASAIEPAQAIERSAVQVIE